MVVLQYLKGRKRAFSLREREQLVHLSLASRQPIMSRNQLRYTKDGQKGSEIVHVYVVWSLLPGEYRTTSFLEISLQLVNLQNCKKY